MVKTDIIKNVGKIALITKIKMFFFLIHHQIKTHAMVNFPTTY